VEEEVAVAGAGAGASASDLAFWKASIQWGCFFLGGSGASDIEG
jgi:hypothetical protein